MTTQDDDRKSFYPHCGNQHPDRPGVHCGKLLEDGRHESPHESGSVTWPGTSPND